ncbi:MAG: bacillithiol biosynthesis deacetylase BshB1 [Thermoanaerobaculia bacterium]|nr:bacillithiol biosynthesis deacetylase BshB1 [Thermoanaerobaculia bacterium]
MNVDALAIGSHPDDVELCCGGTVALLAAAGRRVGIVHLTRGEMGSRGTPEERRLEAEAAARALGAATLDLLDFGDGGLRTGAAEEDELIDLLRRRRPELVLGPPPTDRHPDHRRAHRLVEAACFYAGLARRGAGEPHRPAAVFSYMQHDPFDPDFIVDVSSVWERREAALDCYKSQIHQPGAAARDEPMTKVASPEYRLAVVGRARHFGLAIGAAYGEPFASRLPLAVADPWTLLPGGIR